MNIERKLNVGKIRRSKKDNFALPRVCVCGKHGFALLTQGMVAYFDPEDIDLIDKQPWYAMKGRNGRFYAVHMVYDGDEKKVISLHRQIMGCPEGLLVDHEDGDGLNNRRYNLREATYSQNNSNNVRPVRVHKKDQTLPRGVYPHNKGGFVALVRHETKMHYVGKFSCKIEAARAYDKKARELHGEFATLNNL